MKINIDKKLLNEQISLLGNIAVLNKDQIDLIEKLKNLLYELNCATEGFEKATLEIYTKPEEPKGRMTIRELLTYDADVDVGNNVTDGLGCALCCPMQVTKEGEAEWGDVLDYVVDVDGAYAECVVDDVERWQSKLSRLNLFLSCAAGYCSDSNYTKWFDD